jgi:hypothetical protein
MRHPGPVLFIVLLRVFLGMCAYEKHFFDISNLQTSFRSDNEKVALQQLLWQCEHWYFLTNRSIDVWVIQEHVRRLVGIRAVNFETFPRVCQVHLLWLRLTHHISFSTREILLRTASPSLLALFYSSREPRRHTLLCQ